MLVLSRALRHSGILRLLQPSALLFSRVAPHAPHTTILHASASQDATSHVLWWVAVVCDPAASTPGPNELARTPPEDWWPRDRNARLPWEFLESALKEVVAAGGRRERYHEQYFDKGLHKWHLVPSGGIQWGGRCPNSTAPNEQR